MTDELDFDRVEAMLEGAGDDDDDDRKRSRSRSRSRARRRRDDDEAEQSDDGRRKRDDHKDPKGASKRTTSKRGDADGEDEEEEEDGDDRHGRRRRSSDDRGDGEGADRERSKDERSRRREKEKSKDERSGSRERRTASRGGERSGRSDDKEGRDRKEEKKEKKKKDGERSSDRKKDKHHKDKKRRRDEGRPTSSEDEREKERSRQLRNAQIEEERRKKKEADEKRTRELEEAMRDDLTVLILNLSLKATERDVWTFFSKHCGKVRDIQVIRDQRSGKSKGVGYVEFYTQEAVLKAMSMSGQMVLGQPIKVQASQAEKNRAARVAKQQQAEQLEGGPMRIYVGGLVDSLNNITEQELSELFRPFGDISGVDLHKDPCTGRCKGYAFIQFKRAQDAREAMASMNNMELAGRQIRVGYATDSSNRGNNQTASAALQQNQLQMNLAQQALDLADGERLDDDGGGFLSGASTRIALMQKLQREGDDPPSSVQQLLPPGVVLPGFFPTPQILPSALATAMVAGPMLPPQVSSSFVRMENMFTTEMVLEEGPEFYDDILDDVKGECSKHGVVERAWVDKDKADGQVWMKFTNEMEAAAAKNALHGRSFGGQQVHVETVTEAQWLAGTGGAV
eukprot:Selendium_serpulae@DN5357_c0_g2_i1.p1